MAKPLRRRDVLKTAAGGIAGAALLPLGVRLASAAESADIASVRLSGNVVQVTGAGGNVVVLESPEGLALVDSGAPEHAGALLRFLADELGGAPVRTLFNTHWHLPHTGANEAIGESGATIVAHENTRLWMGTEHYVDWQGRDYAPRPAAALPNHTFYSSDPQPLTLEHGTHRIEYAHLPEAHTDGDIYVRFPDENVIVAGDTLAVGAYPVPDHATGGWIGGLISANEALLELADESTRIVPGTGPVQTRADVEAQLAMLETLLDRISSLILEGKGKDEILAANVTHDYDTARDDPVQFVSNVYDGIWWGGRLRGAY